MKKILLWFLLLASLAFSLFPAWRRHRVEKTSRHAEVALDYDDFLEMCQQEGLPIRQTLLLFKQAGVTSIALPEITLEKLHRMGKLYWIRGEDIPLFHVRVKEKIPYPSVLLFVGDARVREFLGRSFRALLAPSVFRAIPGGFLLKGKWDEFAQMGLGIYPGEAAPLLRMGFFLDPRMENEAEITPSKIQYLLRTVPRDPETSTVIFSGLRNEVLGFDGDIDVTANLMKEIGLRFGYIEAYDPGHVQKGSVALAARIPDQVVKVQSLIVPPLLRTNPERDADTFALGVSERNVRLVYFRPYLTNYQNTTALGTNIEFLKDLKESLEREGISLGKSDTFPLFEPGGFQRVAAAVGAASAFLLLLLMFVDISFAWLGGALAAAAAITALLSFTHWAGLWASVLAFGAAVVFPIFSVVLFSFDKPLSFGKACAALVGATVFTAAGGFLVSSLLAGDLTMLGVEEFRGVKGVLVLPVIFSAWLAWLYHAHRDKARSLGEFCRRFFRPLSDPARMLHLAALLVLLAAGGIMILRSGNAAAGLGIVPRWEKTLRIFMETTLVARPRFKEFMIGHPFFLLAGLWGIESGWGILFLLIGSLGQSDVMDSFAHLHTPFYYTLLRTFHGLWMGILVGGFLYLVARRFAAKGGDHGG